MDRKVSMDIMPIGSYLVKGMYLSFLCELEIVPCNATLYSKYNITKINSVYSCCVSSFYIFLPRISCPQRFCCTGKNTSKRCLRR